MFRFILAFIILVHGLIHLMGFAKAFGYGNLPQLTKDISKTVGCIWLLTALLFITATILLLLKKDGWWMVALIAMIISQVLIFTVWKDAKFGAIANLIILLAIIIGFGKWSFAKNYKNDVIVTAGSTNSMDASLLIETDIKSLPFLVQKYLRYADVLNKPKVRNVKVIFEGEMRDRDKEWFKFKSEQYNYFDKPTRLFFMKAKMFGVTVPGYHAYKNGTATMQIKLFGLIPIINASGKELDKAETVTFFNDMCLLAPATLIDKRISWVPVDSSSVKAIFTNNGISISAILYFNELGQLINFVSDDRYAIAYKKQYRFSTPVGNYKNINGYNLFTHGETVWHYPEGNFTYGKFNLKEVEYNCN